ncbi:Uncharacterised protein [Chlamydia trachomatis]|nr:Uncharacterised protein [Chlamydia trachomatis]
MGGLLLLLKGKGEMLGAALIARDRVSVLQQPERVARLSTAMERLCGIYEPILGRHVIFHEGSVS